ncbi:MAG: DUF1318 domain-containing protein, partial [Candidatus Omnitrophica bacterium]|nr:DUF1318 domain-containing protein [Candidatus Omnitrophota bacterium]
LLAAVLFVLPGVLWADGKYEIKQMTPDVTAALGSQKNRSEQLKELKAGGTIGENNLGYVEVLNDDPKARDVASGENQDRAVIYKAIAVQNNVIGSMGSIEKEFARQYREKAGSSDTIQAEDGKWVVKGKMQEKAQENKQEDFKAVETMDKSQ